MQLLQQALPPEQQMLQRQEREAEEGETQKYKNFAALCGERKISGFLKVTSKENYLCGRCERK